MHSISEIIDSVSIPVLIKDEVIKNGIFETSGDELIYYSGGFTVVFPVIVDQEKWAFRCWHTEIGNVRDRFQIISDYINDLSSPHFCSFYYCDNGLVVDGNLIPTTRMKWVEGIQLNEYLQKYKDDKGRLSSLVTEFVAMCKELHKHHIAHGDLQHGNILVTKTGKMVLVDYDSMYVPKLSGVKDIIVGKPDFQHPYRSKNILASEKLDYFSELVIYICLLTAARKPELIKHFNIEDSLFFKAEDFKDLFSSSTYKKLSQCGEHVNKLLYVLNDFLKESDINNLRPLEVVLNELDTRFEVAPAVIKKGKQDATLKWNVASICEVKIFENNNLIETHKGNGKITVAPTETSTYRMEVETNEGFSIIKNVTLEVFEEAVIKFSTDKKYSYTDVPVKLSWDVKNAISVRLGDEPVSSEGEKVVYPKKETTYRLKVEDKFGTHEEKVIIKMLPLPQIKTLLVPTPEINKPFVITYKPQIVNARINIPSFNFPLVKQHVPLQPSLKERGLYVTLKFPKQSSFKDNIKNILTRFKKNNNEK